MNSRVQQVGVVSGRWILLDYFIMEVLYPYSCHTFAAASLCVLPVKFYIFFYYSFLDI